MAPNGLILSSGRVLLAIAACSVVLTACGSGTDSETDGAQAPDRPSASSQTSPEPPADSDSTGASEPTATDDEANQIGNTYVAPDGSFEIAFPDNYAKQPQENGLTFISASGEFGGEVEYFEAESDLTTQQLEDLYKDRYEQILDDVAWQNSELQPDGSVRIDWIGRNAEGQDLDAIGYIEQRGDRVYILNVYGINEAYDIYLDDSRTIVGSYQVERPSPSSNGGENGSDATSETTEG